MNFKIFITLKGERVCVNLDKVLFFCETNKGVRVVFDDGCYYDYTNTFDEIVKRFDYAVNSSAKEHENNAFEAHILSRFVPDVVKR